MKKLLALVFALMLFAMPVMAEEATALEMLSYTHPDYGFSIQYPANWLAVDATNVDAYIAQYNQGTMTFSGTNAETLTNLKAQIVSQNCVAFIDPYANNMIVAVSDLGMEMTNDIFASAMVPMLTEMLKGQMEGLEIAVEGDITDLGNYPFITIAGGGTMSGMDVALVQLYYCEGSVMNMINMTATSVFGEEVVEQFITECMISAATLALK